MSFTGMNTILVLGAGRSATALINYLLEEAIKNQWHIIVGDVNEQAAIDKVNYASNATAVSFDIHDEAHSQSIIAKADVVISLLPADFHPLVARICLSLKKHLLNASYVSEAMQAMHHDALASGLLFLNECGLDPGIDHMSAMQVIHAIQSKGGVVTSFESFTGGLIAPDTDPENPWRYKFTWNPRNVVMAGQGTAKYLQEGEYKYIPYQQLFTRTTPVNVDGYGAYEGYANRDSLTYLDTYGLRGIKTMVRGTLRHEGYCAAWNILVQLGCCDDTYLLNYLETMSHRDFINAFLDFHPTRSVEEKLCFAFNILPDGEEMKRLRWSGFFSNEQIGKQTGTPAQILEHILTKKWGLHLQDNDLIVMWHRFRYLLNQQEKEIQAHLVVRGDDAVHTAMAKTVGLPLAIAAKLLLTGKIRRRGVEIPVHPEIYNPLLESLASLGIRLVEKEL